jgi:hypothetical protein
VKPTGETASDRPSWGGTSGGESLTARLPDGYPVDRVRLVVRDPRCLFAYWDVDPASLAALGSRHGARVLAVSPLTLRIGGQAGAAPEVFLLSRDERSRYVPAQPHRSYRAELGVTLPWGQFARLSASDTVATPRAAPASVASAEPRDAQGGGREARAGAATPTEPDPSGFDLGVFPGASDAFEPPGAVHRR